MKIEDIKNQRVKISANSITVYNERGKTCGVVRNVRPFTMGRPADNQKYFYALRDAKIWGDSELIKCAVICDDKLYYLHNLRYDETYKHFFENKPGFENEERRYKERQNAAEKIKSVAVVIPCYVR